MPKALLLLLTALLLFAPNAATVRAQDAEESAADTPAQAEAVAVSPALPAQKEASPMEEAVEAPAASAAPAAAESLSPWRLQLNHYADRENWLKSHQAPLPPLTREALEESIEAAGMYLVNQQTSQGNFRYAYDLVSGEEDDSDNQVRQAGALWSICNLNRHRFTEDTRRCAILGLDFFLRGQRGLPDTEVITTTYQGQPVVRTGTVALFCLSLMDFLEGQERYLTDKQQEPFLRALENNLKFLQFQELPSGSWREEYELGGMRLPEDIAPVSPYFDGEALLACMTAARFYQARPALQEPYDLKARCRFSLEALIRKYVIDAFALDGNAEDTRGFYQWGVMACLQAWHLFPEDAAIRDIAWKGAMSLSWWQIYAHRLESRQGNTAFAVEGLAAAAELARLAGDAEQSKLLGETAARILTRLMTWQVGGPFMEVNPFLSARKNSLPQKAFGGITSTQDTGYIRIDVVQHQLHAMLMVAEYLFPEGTP